MNIDSNGVVNLKKIGIYKITNLVTGMFYIGSTRQSFIVRFRHHHSMLKNNKHDNIHLQRSWNKHGEDNMVFEILEVIEDKSKVLDREQYYIDKYSIENLYNINPLAKEIPKVSKEVIIRRTEAIKRFWKDNGTEKLKGKIPWNKGKKYKSTDHLKVPKKRKGDRSKDKAIKRSALPEVDVYDINMNFLGRWNSTKDLEDWSKTNENNLPIIARKGSLKGCSEKQLLSQWIIKSNNSGKPYKNLYFKLIAPPSSNIREESDKLLENPEEDNQQPS